MKLSALKKKILDLNFVFLLKTTVLVFTVLILFELTKTEITRKICGANIPADLPTKNNYLLVTKMDEWQLNKIFSYFVHPDITWITKLKCKMNISYNNVLDSAKQLREKIYIDKNKEFLLKSISKSLWKSFRPVLTSQYKKDLFDILLVFNAATKRHGIPYMLAQGSLLGYLRFQDVSPWDDDMDFVVPIKYWRLVAQVLSCVEGFEIDVHEKIRITFFKRSSPVSVVDPRKKYPFIDIFFYDEDSSYIWFVSQAERGSSIAPKTAYLPARKGTMMGIEISIPNDPKTVATLKYGNLYVCKPQSFQHNRLELRPQVEIPCQLLYAAFGNFSIHKQKPSS